MLPKLLEPQKIFRKSLQYIVNILILYIILILCIGLAKTVYEMKILLNSKPIGQTFAIVVTDILTFLVIIELFKSFIEYFESHRFRLHSMMDPAIIFVVRELIITLYNQRELGWQLLIGFGVLILCLGLVRTMAVHLSPRDFSS
ncbi:MAG TPA: phosphate-starvation-inducible PsiE family protein [Desulfobacterales bacterium]|nr:phosphate-starvation-inducible PsiE family protein [Desulfobacterales bacterium]